MDDSFNQQTTGEVVWEATSNPFDVQSPLGKTISPVHKLPDTLSIVTMTSLFLKKSGQWEE